MRNINSPVRPQSRIQPQTRPTNQLMRVGQKYFVSGFVVFSFTAYAIHDHLTSSTTVEAAPQTTTTTKSTANNVAKAPIVATVAPVDSNASSVSTTSNTSNTTSTALYRDGEYVGGSADAYYGNVQVKVIVQNGQITDVQFLDYPRDRRTSQRINTYATPRLTTEAISAQSAQVDIISGATLTSEAFMQSLQSALDNARL